MTSCVSSIKTPVAASALARLNFPWESIILKVERRAGWAIALSPGFLGTGRKVRTPQGSVLANGQGRSGLSNQWGEGSGRHGQCHRKYTAPA